jgi:choline-glycine betaine transporter
MMWGTLTGLCAAVLLLAGGLNSPQQAAILVAVPFTLVMISLCYALVLDLRREPLPVRVA